MAKKKKKTISAETVLQKNQQRLESIPGVEGIGIGGTQDAPVLLVMVRQLTPELKNSLPASLDGVPVKVEVSGEISAF
jgi:hypothetical protein